MNDDEKLSELEKIKKHLRVTWKHEDDDIQDSIDDGKAIIVGICGNCDFSVAGLAYKLLKAYCRYDRSGSTAMFEENYKKQLIRLQIQNGFSKFKGGE